VLLAWRIFFVDVNKKIMITKHPTSRTLIVHPLGDLDTLRADHYRRQIRSLIDEGYRFLIFDLQDTPYINSSGLGLLIELFNKASRLEGSVKLINCSPHVHWILEQTHLNRIFVEESAEPAAASEELHYDTLYNFMSDELLLLTQIYEVTEQLMALEDASQIGELTLKGIHHALHAQRGAFFFLSRDEHQLQLSSWITREEHASPPPLREAPLIPGRMEHKILEDGEVTWYEPCDQDKSEDNLF
jgi:anti-anti-sigma factor